MKTSRAESLKHHYYTPLYENKQKWARNKSMETTSTTRHEFNFLKIWQFLSKQAAGLQRVVPSHSRPWWAYCPSEIGRGWWGLWAGQKVDRAGVQVLDISRFCNFSFLTQSSTPLQDQPKKSMVIRGKSYKIFYTFEQIYKPILKHDNMLWLGKYLVRLLGCYTLKYSWGCFFLRGAISNLGT